MYICKICDGRFEEPEVEYETHGLSTPPFEVLCICPYCRGTDFEEGLQ